LYLLSKDVHLPQTCADKADSLYPPISVDHIVPSVDLIGDVGVASHRTVDMLLV
jgi:hypothetical protein